MRAGGFAGSVIYGEEDVSAKCRAVPVLIQLHAQFITGVDVGEVKRELG